MLPRIQMFQPESNSRMCISVCERCPMCGGPMVEARTLYRCLRCAFMVCVGCEISDRQLPSEGHQEVS